MEEEKLSSDSYNLYFKGLISSRGFLAGFGVAICDDEDNLLFQMKGSLHDSTITVLKAELMALKRGLTEAESLGITHISICCDDHRIFELVMGTSKLKKDNNIALLMDDVQHIRQRLTYSIPVLATTNQTKLVYQLAMETLVSEISICMPSHAQKKTCGICFKGDFEAERMFYVTLCRHQFCVECIKRHIEVGLLEEKSVLRCPHHGCKLNMTLRSCAHILTPQLREMWVKRIKHDLSMKRWHQCRKCQHMIEPSRGFYFREICRCGYSFCNICGAEWKKPGGGCPHKIEYEKSCMLAICFIFCIFLIIICIGIYGGRLQHV